MKDIIELFKTDIPEQALRRAVVCFGTDPKITIEKIQILIALAKIDTQDDNANSRKTALHLAVIHKKLEPLRILLAANARYDIEDAFGNTALCYAAVTTDETIKKELLTKLVTDTVASVAKEYT